MSDEIASRFIYELGANLSPNDKLFLGVDIMKPKSIALPAYNDSKGITSDFNLNLLHRINHELKANIEVSSFNHQPQYSEKEGIARSYLVSSIKQDIHIGVLCKTFSFEKGEKITTEISRKYNDEIIQKIIKNTDFCVIGKLTDSKKYFSNYILNRKENAN